MNLNAKELVKSFEEAVREHEMMGAKDPESHEEIQRNYEHSRIILLLYIDLLEQLAEK